MNRSAFVLQGFLRLVLLRWGGRCICVLVPLLLSVSCGNEDFRDTHLYEELAADEQWVKLAEKAGNNWVEYGDDFDLNYYYLAQAHRGRLVDELFSIRPNGVSCLFMTEGGVAQDPRSAYIFYAMGEMSAAQKSATASLWTYDSLDYCMLKMLAKIELMRGNDSVADKYLKILKRKGKYRKWAKNARQDPEIERGRRYYLLNDFIADRISIEDMFRILEVNPGDGLVVQYGFAFCLLSKNLDLTRKYVDRLYGTPSLTTLPTPVQEALVACPEFLDSADYAEWCFSKGVTEDTARRFRGFCDSFNSGSSFSLLEYKNTFWFYYFL